MQKPNLKALSPIKVEEVELESLGLEEFHCHDCSVVHWNIKRLTKLHSKIVAMQNDCSEIHKIIVGHTHGAAVTGISRKWTWVIASSTGFLLASTVAFFIKATADWEFRKELIASVFSMMGVLFH